MLAVSTVSPLLDSSCTKCERLAFGDLPDQALGSLLDSHCAGLVARTSSASANCASPVA